jgi:hypothetical protein
VICETKCIWSHYLLLNREKSLSNLALSPEQRQWLDQGRPFDIQAHHKQIRAWQWGDGPGVLLVHGWNGRGIQFERYMAPLVQAGDVRGHCTGRTGSRRLPGQKHQLF